MQPTKRQKNRLIDSIVNGYNGFIYTVSRDYKIEFWVYKKGAFSGAYIDKAGCLSLADGETLFLDEIGEINPNMQVKLLRALDGDGYTPLGSSGVIKPQVRIVCTDRR